MSRWNENEEIRTFGILRTFAVPFRPFSQHYTSQSVNDGNKSQEDQFCFSKRHLFLWAGWRTVKTGLEKRRQFVLHPFMNSLTCIFWRTLLSQVMCPFWLTKSRIFFFFFIIICYCWPNLEKFHHIEPMKILCTRWIKLATQTERQNRLFPFSKSVLQNSAGYITWMLMSAGRHKLIYFLHRRPRCSICHWMNILISVIFTWTSKLQWTKKVQKSKYNKTKLRYL